ncbi:hypothetical protein AAJ76_2700038889 [Vairimorpha ceranae]|uniref:Uncharacterized protein n=1 Tax=Vairimorpha ceranae TaxID=40302 RepID=A0A0F9WEN1_9MICR|nr:hypothetical protein AAJ76_2700038889 [Vairimorpha ceranae]KKO75250.1 hypothetical protein AAJ76_2700038889 [Vairimorpha ceranae]
MLYFKLVIERSFSISTPVPPHPKIIFFSTYLLTKHYTFREKLCLQLHLMFT